MSLRNLCGLLILVIMTLFMLSPVKSVHEVITIKPGIGVGRIYIGNSYGDIMPILDRKHDDMRKAGEGANTEMHMSYETMGLTLIYDHVTKRLKRIMVTNKALLVENCEISVGSSVPELRKYIKKQNIRPTIKKIRNRRHIETWDLKQLGITFWINQDDQTIIAIEIKQKKE